MLTKEVLAILARIADDPLGDRLRVPRRYRDYLRSDAWRARVWGVIIQRGGRCESCGDARGLHLHHCSYIRIGHEDANDVVVLCSGCHGRVHDRWHIHEMPATRLATILALEEL